MIVGQLFGFDDPDRMQYEFDLGWTSIEWATYLGGLIEKHVHILKGEGTEIKLEIDKPVMDGSHCTLRIVTSNPMAVRIEIDRLRQRLRAEPLNWLSSHRPSEPRGPEMPLLYL